MRFDLDTLDLGERLLPFELLVLKSQVPVVEMQKGVDFLFVPTTKS